MCANDKELVLLHQDAFAADYQEDESTLSAWRSVQKLDCQFAVATCETKSAL
jgi:hypothetical protein